MEKNNQPEASDRRTDLVSARKILKKLEARISAERFREYATDKTFMAFCRVYFTGILAANQLQETEELGDIEKRLTQLEQDRKQEEK